MITAWSMKFSFEERERALMMAYFLKGHLDPSDADAGGRGGMGRTPFEGRSALRKWEGPSASW